MSKHASTLPNPVSAAPATKWKEAIPPRPDGQLKREKSVSEEAIRVRAYQIWEAAGKPAGDGVRFLLEAEQELLQGKRGHLSIS